MARRSTRCRASRRRARSSCAPPRPRTARSRRTAFYNLGNAFFKKEKFKEAVEAYKRALTLDPHDARAKWNEEIALQKQKEEEKKKKDEQDKNKDKDKTRDKKDQNKDKKDDKKDQKKNDDGKDKDKKGRQEGPEQERPGQRQGQAGPEGPAEPEDPGEQPPPKADEQEIGAVLDSLERNPKDLEKERARLRAVRRRPPPKDW